jgi:hypothetical protein
VIAGVPVDLVGRASHINRAKTAHRYLTERREWFDSVLGSGGLLIQDGEDHA